MIADLLFNGWVWTLIGIVIATLGVLLFAGIESRYPETDSGRAAFGGTARPENTNPVETESA